MIFLNNSQAILNQLSRVIAKHDSLEPIKIAVAFWGNGALSLLDESKRYFIICNLRSGGTNPSVIETLVEMPNITILQNDALHAKVVLSSSGAIVSSANFSSDGLHFGNNHCHGWIEAGIFIHNQHSEIARIEKWFAEIAERSTQICSDDIAKAKEAWDSRHIFAPNSESTMDSESPTLEDMIPPLTEQRICTLNEPGNGGPLFLRSASAILALNGESGKSMPLNAFVFLFSGDNGRAFQTHKKKFHVNYEAQTVSLERDYIGYFVGEDGTMETSTDKKRRNNVSTATARALANWMMGNGTLPAEAQGTITCERYKI
jgi:hypothetical protein